jgi:hypothetical protein
MMNTHDNGVREHGVFYFHNERVIGYGLLGAGGGKTSVFSFLSEQNAVMFAYHIKLGGGDCILNGAQVIAFGDYCYAMNYIPQEQIGLGSFCRGGMWT